MHVINTSCKINAIYYQFGGHYSKDKVGQSSGILANWEECIQLIVYMNFYSMKSCVTCY